MRSHQRAILSVLAELPHGAGYLTHDVASRTEMFGHNRRIHSGATRSWLLELERDGLVTGIDDEKPTCWCLTDAGRADVAKAEDVEEQP